MTSVRLSGDYLLGLALAGATCLACADRRAIRAVIGCVCAVGTFICADGLIRAAPLQPHYGASVVDNRATGVFVQPNELGAFAAVIVILSVGLMLSARRGDVLRGDVLPGLAGVSLVVSAGALVITLSRSAWLGLVLGLVVVVVLAPSARRPVTAALTVTAATITSVLLIPSSSPLLSIVADRAASFVDGQRNPYDFRPQIWLEALRQIAAHPWLGTGPGGYSVVAGRNPSRVAAVLPEHAHNLILTVAAEQGMVGVLAIGLTVGVAVVAVARYTGRQDVPAIRSPRAPVGDRELLASLAGALAVALGQGLLDHPLRNAVLATTVWLQLGLLAAILSNRGADQPGGHGPDVLATMGRHGRGVARGRTR
jgi:O-antigen ligase